ncbi:hypothetical protein Heshes_11790 [Alicyclobacillus hesperidum]|uniref:DJ-1/PfpI family protein n=1 Tax=Alicyclobacillus hesperidum TaxID=89784 RepID=A0A1H2RR98_9BACL|nr:DJ-1/PfpI family protein [Alicyclobacillus hesperidum]GLV13495.1 hypothetical protein Heshes_11790 [Alicyclobacillus hesperidum]SDW21986.1 DJ-1/PfpI family protein [Alicyclobacillus hesperidum]
MPKAAFIALPKCRLHDVSPLLETLALQDWRLRTLTLDGAPCTTAEGLAVCTDGSVEEAVPLDLALCVLPGGLYPAQVWNDIRLHRYVRQFAGRKGWFAVSGEGSACLAAAGLLGGLRFSAPLSFVESQAPLFRYSIHMTTPISIDGGVVSSDGSDPAGFCQAVFGRLNIGV